MNAKVEKLLNRQIKAEAQSSHIYLAMAVWSENQGIGGTAAFMYKHSEEERMHMLKLIRFVNERGGKAEVPSIDAPKIKFKSVREIFTQLLEHEIKVTNLINEVVFVCQEQKDFTTNNFMQWYVAEQLEEEALARTILDRLKLVGDDKGGLYLFDRDLENLPASQPAPAG